MVRHPRECLQRITSSPMWYPAHCRPTPHQPTPLARSPRAYGPQPPPTEGNDLPPQRRQTTWWSLHNVEKTCHKRPGTNTPIRHLAVECCRPKQMQKNYSSWSGKFTIRSIQKSAEIDSHSASWPERRRIETITRDYTVPKERKTYIHMYIYVYMYIYIHIYTYIHIYIYIYVQEAMW